MSTDKKEEERITLCKCFACKKNYLAEFMKEIRIKEPFEESYITVKRYICPECKERLKQFKFVLESELEKNRQKEKSKQNKKEDEEND